MAAEVAVADVAVVVGALLLGSLVKATLGFGAPLIALPILALGLSSEDAVVLMALPGVVSNVILVYTTRSHYHETVDLKAILYPSIPTAIVGTLILSELPDRGISVMMAAMLVTYLVVRQFRPDATLTPGTRRWLAPTVGTMGGLSQGAVGLSLPWYGPYLHTLRLTPGAFTHEVCAFFLFPTAVQMVTLAAVGEYDARRIWLSIIASAVFLMTLPVGSRIRRTMTPAGFETAVLAMLAVAAVALVTQAVIG
jgi:uncharacterized membrane protein YfcA